MKVKALSPFNYGGPVKTGDEIEVSDENGISLVINGLAQSLDPAIQPEVRKIEEESKPQKSSKRKK
jgi:hypothetical protein